MEQHGAAWQSTEHLFSSYKSLWTLEFLGTSQDQIQIVPRQVKFNTIITQNNPQSQQQSEASANTKELRHTFQDSDMEIFKYLSFHYTHK